MKLPTAFTLLAVLLSGCAPPAVKASAPPPPVIAPETQAEAPPPSASLTTPAAVATRAYRKAEATEGHAISKPNATAASVSRIRIANELQRKALRALVAQDGHPTKAAIDEAKRTLDDLVRALEEDP